MFEASLWTGIEYYDYKQGMLVDMLRLVQCVVDGCFLVWDNKKVLHRGVGRDFGPKVAV